MDHRTMYLCVVQKWASCCKETERRNGNNKGRINDREERKGKGKRKEKEGTEYEITYARKGKK
jgi:hypothetical protein